MKICSTLAILLLLVATIATAQPDSGAKNITGVYARITREVMNFKLDTSAAPDDKITRKIIALRTLRGGFNINEAINYKLEEEKGKGNLSVAEGQKLSAYFSEGNGKRWLNNALVWIYRRQFTYPELKQLVKFYKTSAGQKMATEFPVMMMQSLQAAEMIKGFYGQEKGVTKE